MAACEVVMSYVPGWLTDWAEAQSLNPDRPERWPEAAKAAFMAEKLRRFKMRWQWQMALGQPQIIREQSGRDALIREVRREIQDALAPCPTSLGLHDHVSPYRKPEPVDLATVAAGHTIRTYPDGSREVILPPRPKVAERDQARLDPWKQIPIEDVLAWVSERPERAGMSETVARCLYWLQLEFSPGRALTRLTRGNQAPKAETEPAPEAPVRPDPLIGSAASQ